MLQLNDIRESRFFKEAAAIGRAEGEAQGRAEGRAEMLTEIIRKLAAQGRSKTEIADTLDLTEDRVHEVLGMDTRKD